MITCPSCGRENADNFNFCLDCGTDLTAQPEAQEPVVEPVEAAPVVSQTAAAAPSQTAPIAAAQLSAEPATEPLPLVDPVEPAVAASEPVILTTPTGPVPQATDAIPLTQPVGNGPVGTAPGGTAPAIAAPSVSATAPVQPVAPSTQPPLAQPEPTVAPPVQAPVTTTASAVPAGSPIPTGTATSTPAVAPQGSPCPACGTVNADGMKFCGNCGQRLDGAPNTTMPPQAAEAAPGAGATMFMHAADVSTLSLPKARLITIDQQGREGMTFNITAKETLCGRTNGTILFFDDNFVSPTHCAFDFDQGHLTVIDHNSLNGVFVRVRGEWPLDDADMIRVGRQLFRLDGDVMGGEKFLIPAEGDDAKTWGSPDPEAWGRLLQVLESGKAGEVHLLRGEEVRIGRETGDIILSNDGFVSSSHCALSAQGARIVLRDLGSSNGTYVRLREPRELQNDDFILIGNQMLRVELR